VDSLSLELVDFKDTLRAEGAVLENWLAMPEKARLELPNEEELRSKTEELKEKSQELANHLAGLTRNQPSLPGHTGRLFLKRLLTLSQAELERLAQLRKQAAGLVPSTTLDLQTAMEELTLQVLKLKSDLLDQGMWRSHTCNLSPSAPAPSSAPPSAAEAPRWLQVGVVLGERYKIEAVIGRGGTGAVYKVSDLRTPQEWAVKELWSDVPDAEQLGLKHQLDSEITVLSKLRHQNLPRIVDAFESDNRHYIVMDYVRGRDLRLILKDVGRLPLELALDLGIQLANVLHYLHSQPQPIIFRDLKPANIMVDSHGVVKLVDFGIARHFLPEATGDTRAFGTPGYAAPEQYGSSQSDQRSDIYTLGATLHELITGRNPGEQPFSFPPMSALVPEAPPELDVIVGACVAMDPNQRYPSMERLLVDLNRVKSRLGRAPKTAVPGLSFSGLKAGSVLTEPIQIPATFIRPLGADQPWLTLIESETGSLQINLVAPDEEGAHSVKVVDAEGDLAVEIGVEVVPAPPEGSLTSLFSTLKRKWMG
jgi:tRNA A-37 threonylcarbamoyl transferase component Bud32